MRKKHKITTKLSLAYILLIVIFILIFSLLYYENNRKYIYDYGVKNLSDMVIAAMEQTDSRLGSMEQVAVEILGNNDFIRNWQEQKWKNSETDLNEIKAIINNAYIHKTDIRRVSVFNAAGDALATADNYISKANVKARFQELDAQNKYPGANWRKLVGPHRDFWDSGSDSEVISLIKPVKDFNNRVIGYLEVQQNTLYIKKINDLKFNEESLDVVMYLGEADDLFYTTIGADRQDYLECVSEATRQYSKIRDQEGMLLLMQSSKYFPGNLVCVIRKDILYKPLDGIRWGILIISAILTMISVLYARMVIKRIMKPINSMVRHMSNIELLGLKQAEKAEAKDQETEVLSNAFNEMIERFQEAIEKQEKMEKVQTRTLFGVLQSEMSPHFLYNTLGSIANMCENGEHEEAAEACYGLTDILRYASNYKTHEARIEEEVANINAYLSLMKSRYRQRLSYEIIDDEEAYNFIVPKLTYQPLIENAIKYSLLEQDQVLIQVFTVVIGECLIIEIKDNGCGISAETAVLIKRRIEDFKQDVSVSDSLDRIGIGGMGLAGTLIRLEIFFGKDFSYQLLDNNDEGGTTIALMINMSKNR